MRIEEVATDADRRRVRELLRSNGLPHEDVETSPVTLVGGYEDGGLVGVGGLERYGTDALVRSLAVRQALRGQGYGTAIYREVETRAREAGAERLFLLTTTADGFFADLGFDVVDRGEVPEAIGETAEFRELCPSGATCMRKVVR